MENVENQILVIFGASGDLTKRKLIPSLFQLYEKGMLPKKFAILGVARSAYPYEQYREMLKEAFIKNTKPEEESIVKFGEFLKLVYYQSLETTNPESYEPLKIRLQEMSTSLEIPDNYLYYLSTPPTLYEVIPKGLKAQGLHKESAFTGFRRIIIEKKSDRSHVVL